MSIPFTHPRNHAEEIANVRAGFPPIPEMINRHSLEVRGFQLRSARPQLFVGFSKWTALLAAATCVVIAGTRMLPAEEAIEPVDQRDLNEIGLKDGSTAAFEHAFEAGDELSEFQFNATHGVGANIGEGRIFTRIPRADLTGEGEWASHFPKREGGANATSCVACHNAPAANGAGGISENVVLDPNHTGDPKLYLERNTLPILALGPVQRVAEEMSLELYAQRDGIREMACSKGAATTALTAKGIGFGDLTANRTGVEPCVVEFDVSGVQGVDADLVVRAFGWKGNHATIRSFTRGAAHNELGLQAVETVGDLDGDFDGVTNELTVGDMTALTIYMAALERPVTQIELADLGLVELPDEARNQIVAGEAQFGEVGCASCHVPSLELDMAVYKEPTTTPGFFDVMFPDGSNPENHGFHGGRAIEFDMTADQPNNRIAQADGSVALLGALSKDQNGTATFAWLSDFKRHDMGPELSDPDDPLGIGAQMWLTRSLAGVASTGPWLHDGRATTLDDAILAHGGEAQPSRDAYATASAQTRAEIIAFLESQVIFKFEDEAGG